MSGFIVFITCIVLVLIILLDIMFIPSLITIIKMMYYEQVDGTIIDKESKFINTTDLSRKATKYKYEFYYLDKKYNIEDKGYGLNNKLDIGQLVKIYVKKGDPNVYLYPNKVRDRYFYFIISLMGILPLLFILILIFFII